MRIITSLATEAPSHMFYRNEYILLTQVNFPLAIDGA